MKRYLTLLIGFLAIFAIIMISCVDSKPVDRRQYFHGVGYCNKKDKITLPLETWGDYGTTKGSLDGIFVIGVGAVSGDLSGKLVYRFIAKFPDGTMKTYEFDANERGVYLKYGSPATITSDIGSLEWGERYYGNSEVIIQIPKGTIQYDNKFDGQ